MKETNISREELGDKIAIAAAEVLKNNKMKRNYISRIQKNISDVSNIFGDGFSDLDEIELYLHRETQELIEQSINLVIAKDCPDIMSRFSKKNNIVALSLSIFIDYLIFRDTIFNDDFEIVV